MTAKHLREGKFNCPNCGAAATPDSVRCAYCHTGLASLVCASCFGAIFNGMKHCPWCGTDGAAGRPAETASGSCPRCAGRLHRVAVASRSIQECTSCGGLWVDAETLQQICTEQEEQEAVLEFQSGDEFPIHASDEKPQRMYIPCPECGKLMNRRQFSGGSGIIVDWCKAHGTWFDRDELKQVVRFILDGGLAKSRQKEKLKLEDEKLHLREEKRNLLRIARLGSEPDRMNGLGNGDSEILNVLGVIWRDLK